MMKSNKLWAALAAIVFCLVPSACSDSGDDSADSKINPPDSASSFEGEDYQDVVTRFKKAGFTNVQTKAQEDLITGWLTKEDEVDKVSIDGETDFMSSDRYDSDAKVVVTYHAFPEQEENKSDDSGTSADDSDTSTDEVPQESEPQAESPAQENPAPAPNPETQESNPESGSGSTDMTVPVRVACKEAGEKAFPYGYDPHSFMGVVQEVTQQSDGSYFYSVEADVTNAFGQEREMTVECTAYVLPDGLSAQITNAY